tara:strand:+ start:145 stop:387 length:243 start_codon:yes stop_codon:yes gene_type:complete
MKGVKYNLIFTTAKNKKLLFLNLPINNMMETLENTIQEEYNIKMKITKNMIYNLVHRPLKVNRVVRQFSQITFSTRNIEG